MAKRVLVFFAIFLLAWVSTLGFTHTNGTGVKENVVYLGTVDGKSFFSQMTPTMTWLEAKGNCTESGMQLASITSIAQRTLLNEAYNNVTFNGNLWTSARDALLASQLVWDTSTDTLNNTVVNHYHSISGILTCLACFISVNPPMNFYAYSCTQRLGAICEIDHGKQAFDLR